MTLKLIAKEHLIDNVWSFRFEPKQPLSWTAGQFIRVELEHDNPDQEGTKRWFTISSAPFEGLIQITTRITNSSFKQALSKLEAGSEQLVCVDLPDGDFTWQPTGDETVFIAGGIGITPFYSILKQCLHDGANYPLNITLLYGTRDNMIPFKDELEAWQEANNSLKVIFVSGEPLDSHKITTLLPSINNLRVYLSGPEPMVEKLGNDLMTNGLPKDQLKQDFFPHYNEQNY